MHATDSVRQANAFFVMVWEPLELLVEGPLQANLLG